MMDILDENFGKKNVLSAKAIADLKATTPWIKLLTVLGFVIMGLLSLTMLGLTAMALATKSLAIIGTMLFSIGVFALQFFIILTLHRYANKLKEFTLTQKMESLEAAFVQQKRYYTIVGIIVLCILVIYLLLFIFMGAQMMAIFTNMYKDKF